MEIKNLIYIFILLVVIYFLTRKFTIEKIENIADMNAAEACKKISSKAEELEQHYKGAANVVTAAFGPLNLWNPNAYKAGDNTSSDLMRNIINTNLSKDDITKIENECKNSSATAQNNIIDMTQCDYCNKHGCDVSNVEQINVSDSNKSCTLQSAVDILMTKTNSIDAQALAQTLQKAQDVLSGNNDSKKENCNIINTDMSSKEYMDIRNRCVNESSVIQNNELKGCGAVMNVIQKNASNDIMDCIIGNTVKKQSELKADTKVKTEQKSEQFSSGISPMASLGASLSSVLSSCVICIAAYFMYDSDTTKQAVQIVAENPQLLAAASDVRLKKNIKRVTYGLKELSKLEPKSYNYINENNETTRHIGVMAQDLKNIMPELVVELDNNSFRDTLPESLREETLYGVKYHELVPVLINSIKELKNEIEILKQNKC